MSSSEKNWITPLAAFISCASFLGFFFTLVWMYHSTRQSHAALHHVHVSVSP